MENKPEIIETPEAKIARLEAQLAAVKLSQGGSDAAYQREKKRADALESKIAKGQSEAEMLSRLDGIQKAYAAKERRLDLKFYCREKAFEAGISYDLVSDLDFADEPAAERKIAQFAEMVTARSLEELDKRLGMSVKPQSGNNIPRTASILDGIADRATGGNL